MNSSIMKMLEKLPSAKGKKVDHDAKKLALGKVKKEMNTLDAEKYLSEDEASDKMDSVKEGVTGVSVMAKDKEGLEKGLDMAKKITEKMPEAEMGEEEGEKESEMVDVMEDIDSLSAEEVDMLLAKLQERKSKMES